jgi:alpha-beta hydrolase superfamily lysophospholipase
MQTLTLDSDGTPVTAYGWAAPSTVRGVVQITHGMGEHAQRYAELATVLNGAGFAVYAQDHRGHGATSAPEAYGSLDWGALVGDIDRLRATAVAEHPGVPLVLLGHSMGSFAVQQYLVDHSASVEAAILTGTSLLDVLEPAMDLDARTDLSAFNAPFQPARTDFDWLSRDEAQVDAYVSDPRCGFGLDAASARAMFAAARVVADPARLASVRSDLPLYVAAGEFDPLHGNLALVNLLVERYRTAGLVDVTLKVYPGARHEIFNETNRAEVYADLIAWLAERV